MRDWDPFRPMGKNAQREDIQTGMTQDAEELFKLIQEKAAEAAAATDGKFIVPMLAMCQEYDREYKAKGDVHDNAKIDALIRQQEENQVLAMLGFLSFPWGKVLDGTVALSEEDTMMFVSEYLDKLFKDLPSMRATFHSAIESATRSLRPISSVLKVAMMIRGTDAHVSNRDIATMFANMVTYIALLTVGEFNAAWKLEAPFRALGMPSLSNRLEKESREGMASRNA